jgi:hypothetical protein
VAFADYLSGYPSGRRKADEVSEPRLNPGGQVACFFALAQEQLDGVA